MRDATKPFADRIPVLMYHRIGEPVSTADRKYCVRASDFQKHMHALAARGYTAVTIDAFFHWLDGRTTLPAGAFVLTFDDGFRGVKEHGLPVLRDLEWPFTVFLVAGFLGGTDTWNAAHQRAGAELLDRDEVIAMAQQGVRFESHTSTHRRLPELSDRDLASELTSSRQSLEALLGRRVHYLAYPFGEVDDRVVAAAKRGGYSAAFSTQPGFNRQNIDRFFIRRLDVFGTDTAGELLRKISLGSNDGSISNAVGYFGRRLTRKLRSW